VWTTLDQNTPNQKVMKREQVIDTHGNQTQLKVYDYKSDSGSLTTPMRTWTHTYENGAEYASRYIFNRLKTTQVADELGQETTLVSNSYDQYGLTNLTGLRQHDTVHYGAGFAWRGNVTTRVAGGVTTTFRYDIAGSVTRTDDGTTVVDVTSDASKNYAVPSVITPNSNSSLQESLSYTAFLAVNSDTLLNGATTSMVYDNYARPQSSTSVHGGSTSYS